MLAGSLHWILSLPLQRASSRTNRSEEHTSELQSQSNLVCRLLLEKKKKNYVAAVSLWSIFQISAYIHLRLDLPNSAASHRQSRMHIACLLVNYAFCPIIRLTHSVA